MNTYEIELNEVILYEEVITYSDFKGDLILTLTSKKIIFEKEKGKLKKSRELIDIINLSDIKMYNNKPQVTHKTNEVSIQTINKNIKIYFNNIFKPSIFISKIIDVVTGTTITERNVNKIKDAINNVDDVLGINPKDTLKSVVENGIAGSILHGIKKKK